MSNQKGNLLAFTSGIGNKFGECIEFYYIVTKEDDSGEGGRRNNCM